MNNPITTEHIATVKKHINTAGRIALKVAKYGTVFTGGVLVGTIAGVVLFFQLSDGDWSFPKR